jgi:hypothetical protein
LQTIRAILARTVARGAEEIGTYLLKTFFDDDLSVYNSGRSKRHATLARLVARCGTHDLPVSRTFISNAIRMVAVARSLPPTASFQRLPVSHRVELIKLPSTDKIEALSRNALESQCTVRELRANVAAHAVHGKGRPASPAPLLAARRVSHLLRDGTSTAESSKPLTEGQRREALHGSRRSSDACDTVPM